MRISFLNTENLFCFPPGPLPRRYDKNSPVPKKKEKLNDLANCIKDIDADIFMLCELGGLESLSFFNDNFLGWY